jgi:hypothetical protein
MTGTSTPQPFALDDLLVRAGARIRGRGRADCPRCKRRRAISFDKSKGVYRCHGAGCDFSGGSAKLARGLGLAPSLSQEEYGQLHRRYESADRAARGLYGRVRTRRLELCEDLRCLGRLGLRAHEAGMNHPAVWGALALIYRRRPRLTAELMILENCGVPNLIQFFSAGKEAKDRMTDSVLMAGGLYDSRARFVETLL